MEHLTLRHVAGSSRWEVAACFILRGLRSRLRDADGDSVSENPDPGEALRPKTTASAWLSAKTIVHKLKATVCPVMLPWVDSLHPWPLGRHPGTWPTTGGWLL